MGKRFCRHRVAQECAVACHRFVRAITWLVKSHRPSRKLSLRERLVDQDRHILVPWVTLNLLIDGHEGIAIAGPVAGIGFRPRVGRLTRAGDCPCGRRRCRLQDRPSCYVQCLKKRESMLGKRFCLSAQFRDIVFVALQVLAIFHDFLPSRTQDTVPFSIARYPIA